MHGVGRLLPEIPPAHVLLLRIPDYISFCHKGPARFTLKLLFAQFSYLFLTSLTLGITFHIRHMKVFFLPSGQNKLIFSFWKKKKG